MAETHLSLVNYRQGKSLFLTLCWLSLQGREMWSVKQWWDRKQPNFREEWLRLLEYQQMFYHHLPCVVFQQPKTQVTVRNFIAIELLQIHKKTFLCSAMLQFGHKPMRRDSCYTTSRSLTASFDMVDKRLLTTYKPLWGLTCTQTHTSSFFLIMAKVTTIIAPENLTNFSVHKQTANSLIIKESQRIDFLASC